MSSEVAAAPGTPAALPHAPYKGLAAYGEDDAPWFFGRDAERELVIANLMAARFTVVFGGSGVGKSSLLRAGVKHGLRELARKNVRRLGTPQLAVVVFNAWRDDPLTDLLRSIRRAVGEAWQVPNPAEAADPGDQSLAEALQRGAESVDGEVFVILDQFEEYFQYHARDQRQGGFAVELARAIANEAVRASFLVSIREDALAKLDAFEDRIPNLFGNFLRIDHLDRDAARQAIEGPIERYNRLPVLNGSRHTASVEPALVEAVLDQVRIGRVSLGQSERLALSPGSGALAAGEHEQIETPYLQLVMNRLWETELADAGAEGDVRLQLSTLERLGGAERIVHTHLDATMDELPAPERDIAARMFTYLVTPSGTKIAHSAADLAAYTGVEPADVEPVLARLSEARILMPVAPVMERAGAIRYQIFHDVLGAAVLDWRMRYLRDRERALAGRQLAMERRRVLHLRRGVISLSGLLLAVIVLAVVALLQPEAAGSAQQVALSRAAGQQLESLFLGCFAFGALFTLASALLGFHGTGAHGAHPGHPGGGHHAPGAPHGGSGLRQRLAPVLNAPSLLAFLTWFGAAGYLLERFAEWVLAAVLLGAIAAGGLGWYLISRFLELILSGEREMDPEDYRLEGTIGRVTIPIPAGGTGEVVFTKGGVRRSEAARAVAGAIPRGTEVLITRYGNGFATVEPWSEVLEDRHPL